MTTSRPELIGTVDVSRILGISRAGVLKRVRTGALNPASTIGRRGTYVFDRAEIEAIAAKEKTA